MTLNPLISLPIACCVIAIQAGTPTGITAQDGLDSWHDDVVRQAVNRVQPALVRMESVGGTNVANPIASVGRPFTGTVVDRDGHIVTAAVNLQHDPAAIIVQLPDGRRVNATRVGRNLSRHVELLKIDESIRFELPQAARSVSVGQTAIAVGKSLDPVVASISTGIVSATGRIRGRAIQTDASVSLTNYGGPLIDLEGNVLGILVPLSPTDDDPGAGLEWYDSGIGFAVSLDELQIDRMAGGETLVPGQLGISFHKDLGFASRPLVAAIHGDSPAWQADIRPGDLVTSVNSQPTKLLVQLEQVIGPLYAGDQVKLTIERDGQSLERQLTLVDRVRPWQHGMLGILPDPGDLGTGGVPVRFVRDNSPAADAGIQPGDRLVSLNQQAVTDRESLAKILTAIPAETEIQLEIVRQKISEKKTLPVRLALMDASPWPVGVASPFDQLARQTVFRLRMAGDSSDTWAFVPQSSQAPGLLVWLVGQEIKDPESEMARWSGLCERYGMAMILVSPTSADGWESGEATRIQRLVQQIGGDFSIDEMRIAIGGSSSAGIMASIVALRNPQMFRGLILASCGTDEHVQNVDSSPMARQSILLLCPDNDPALVEMTTAATASLQKRGFPAAQLAMTDADQMPAVVMQWAETLDRF